MKARGEIFAPPRTYPYIALILSAAITANEYRKGGRTIKTFMEKLSKTVDQIAAVITNTVMAVLCILIFVSVIFRWLLNNPIVWQYEATLVGFSWMIFIGMSQTFRTQEHLVLTFITNALKKKVRVVWINVIDVVCIAFLITAIACSFSILESTFQNSYMTIPVSRGIFYLPFPIGAAFSVIHLVNHILHRNVENVGGKRDLGEDEDEIAGSSLKEA